MKKLFGILALVPSQKSLVDEWCFKKCGKILMGILSDDLVGMIPCKEEKCPIEGKRMKYGKLENGDVVWVRKLKELNETSVQRNG